MAQYKLLSAFCMRDAVCVVHGCYHKRTPSECSNILFMVLRYPSDPPMRISARVLVLCQAQSSAVLKNRLTVGPLRRGRGQDIRDFHAQQGSQKRCHTVTAAKPSDETLMKGGEMCVMSSKLQDHLTTFVQLERALSSSLIRRTTHQAFILLVHRHSY